VGKQKTTLLPDGKFYPMDLNCVEKSVKERLENIITEHAFFTIRTANLTVPHKGR
jgi:hypothetical protein